MRISQICPTCTTYINSLCIVYNGIYLSNINASPLNSLDTILANVNTAMGSVNASVASINASITTTNGNVALKENSSNKSNDGTFNSGVPSATLFPTQSAVATYISTNVPAPGWKLTGNTGTTAGTNFIGTTDTQDVVFKANSVEYFKLSVVDQVLVLSKSLTCNSSSTSEIAVRSTAIINNGFVAINQNSTDKGNVQINNGDGTTKIKTLASALTRTVSFPNADGTIALVSDIPAPGWKLTGNTGTSASTNFIGTIDNTDFVIKTDNYNQLIFRSTATSGNIETEFDIFSIATSNGGNQIIAKAINPTVGFAALRTDGTLKGIVAIGNGTVTGKIVATNLTTSDKTYQLPDANGTLALTSDIVATYKSYVAIVYYDGSLFTQVVLKNDFGSTVFTWSSPSISVFRITPSATSFTVNKTVAFVNSYENNYLVTPKRAFNPSLDYVNLTHIKYDGTSNTMVAGNFFIEIRVYP